MEKILQNDGDINLITMKEVKINFTVTLPVEAQKEAEEQQFIKSRSQIVNRACHRLAEFTQTKYDSCLDAIEIGENVPEIKEYELSNGVIISWDINEKQ